MKNNNPVFILLIVVGVLSCATQKNGSNDSIDSYNDKKETPMEVTLSITITSDYCGGVPPTDEMIEELNTPITLENSSLLISTQEGLQDNMIELQTGEEGSAKVNLPKGTYYVFLPEKKIATLSSKYRSEEDCNRWKNTPNGTFTIGNSTKVSFNIHRTCDECSDPML